ncbi:ankyrin repeat domain-containing protein [Desulfosarcina cetonica]|uniref:ankyrin repeat domain-containing protein n=1 Tax=Desulfosarcina cetonica TaxID=90730 RepID=UPI0006CF3F79|nr:ankyrin repeat domain-containing protein [Desulfosarcina cetonica]
MKENIFETIYENDLSGLKELLESDPEQVGVIRLEDRMTPIILACEYGQPEIVRLLLEYGANADDCLDDGETPLHIAAFEGAEDCVKFLLKAGANPNVQTSEGKTPLMNASQSGSYNIVLALLSNNANPLATDQFGRSAFIGQQWGNMTTILLFVF